MDAICVMCGKSNQKNKLYAIHTNGRITYECIDEKKCKIHAIQYNIEQQQQYRDQFIDDYGISFEELILYQQENDYEICYIHKPTGRIFFKYVNDPPDKMPVLKT